MTTLTQKLAWLASAVAVVVIVAVLVVTPNSAVKETPRTGSTPGADFYSPEMSFNGVVTAYRNGRFASATTTVLALRSPTFATSTLSKESVCNFAVSSTTASTVTIAKASTAFATTTLIRSVAVAANAQAQFPLASTTVGTLVDSDLTFAPGDYLVVGMAGGVVGGLTFSPTGACSAVFNVAQ